MRTTDDKSVVRILLRKLLCQKYILTKSSSGLLKISERVYSTCITSAAATSGDTKESKKPRRV